MKFSRALIAVIAAPIALSLAACGGSSSSTTSSSSTASVRFVNGSPDIGPVDLYFTPLGSTISTSPTVSNSAYGAITDFQSLSAASGQLYAYVSGASTATASPKLSCAIPAVVGGGIYTIVVSGQISNSTLQCTLFQEIAYSANGQMRMHHASPAAAAVSGFGTVAYGNYVPPFAATPLAVIATDQFPGYAVAGGTTQTIFETIAVTAVSTQTSPVGVAVGSYVSGATTFTGSVNIDATKIVAPGTTTAPDTAGTIPGGGYNNTSIFAIDCTTATTPQGTTCASGFGLIGSFDSK